MIPQKTSSSHYFYVSKSGKYRKWETYGLNTAERNGSWKVFAKNTMKLGCVIRVRMGVTVRRLQIKHGKLQLIKGY